MQDRKRKTKAPAKEPRQWPPSQQRKYQLGQRLTLVSLVMEIEAGHYVFYGRHRPMSPKWLRNWSLHTLILNVKRGAFYQALPVEKAVPVVPPTTGDVVDADFDEVV